MVKVLGGADISWIVGWVVAGVAYLIAVPVAGASTTAVPADTADAVTS